MPKGVRPGGRQKGTPNKLSGQAKENVIAVFTRIGGTGAMAEWAMENQTQFYQIYAKLLPIEATVSADPDKPFRLEIGWANPSKS